MLRIFRSEKELNEAERRYINPDYAGYINNIQTSENHIGNLTTPFGYMEQTNAGHLLTLSVLDCLKTFFISKNFLYKYSKQKTLRLIEAFSASIPLK